MSQFSYNIGGISRRNRQQNERLSRMVSALENSAGSRYPTEMPDEYARQFINPDGSAKSLRQLMEEPAIANPATATPPITPPFNPLGLDRPTDAATLGRVNRPTMQRESLLDTIRGSGQALQSKLKGAAGQGLQPAREMQDRLSEKLTPEMSGTSTPSTGLQDQIAAQIGLAPTMMGLGIQKLGEDFRNLPGDARAMQRRLSSNLTPEMAMPSTANAPIPEVEQAMAEVTVPDDSGVALYGPPAPEAPLIVNTPGLSDRIEAEMNPSRFDADGNLLDADGNVLMVNTPGLSDTIFGTAPEPEGPFANISDAPPLGFEETGPRSLLASDNYNPLGRIGLSDGMEYTEYDPNAPLGTPDTEFQQMLGGLGESVVDPITGFFDRVAEEAVRRQGDDGELGGIIGQLDTLGRTLRGIPGTVLYGSEPDPVINLSSATTAGQSTRGQGVGSVPASTAASQPESPSTVDGEPREGAAAPSGDYRPRGVTSRNTVQDRANLARREAIKEQTGMTDAEVDQVYEQNLDDRRAYKTAVAQGRKQIQSLAAQMRQAKRDGDTTREAAIREQIFEMRQAMDQEGRRIADISNQFRGTLSDLDPAEQAEIRAAGRASLNAQLPGIAAAAEQQAEVAREEQVSRLADIGRRAFQLENGNLSDFAGFSDEAFAKYATDMASPEAIDQATRGVGLPVDATPGAAEFAANVRGLSDIGGIDFPEPTISSPRPIDQGTLQDALRINDPEATVDPVAAQDTPFFETYRQSGYAGDNNLVNSVNTGAAQSALLEAVGNNNPEVINQYAQQVRGMLADGTVPDQLRQATIREIANALTSQQLRGNEATTAAVNELVQVLRQASPGII